MVQWSRLDKAVVARGRPVAGPTWGSGWSRSGSVQQKLRSDPLPLAWVVLLDTVDAQVNGPCLLSSVMKPDPMDQRGLCLHQSSRTQLKSKNQKISDPHLQKTVGVFSDRIVALDRCRSGHITTLGKSSHSRTYRVRWVCWHGAKKSWKMAQPALEGLKCNSVSRSCRSCRKSHVWSLEFSLLGLARKIRRQTIMTWGSICLVDGDWLCFFRVPDEQLCVCNVFSVLNHILG